jgi:hypothetical protein
MVGTTYAPKTLKLTVGDPGSSLDLSEVFLDAGLQGLSKAKDFSASVGMARKRKLLARATDALDPVTYLGKYATALKISDQAIQAKWKSVYAAMMDLGVTEENAKKQADAIAAAETSYQEMLLQANFPMNIAAAVLSSSIDASKNVVRLGGATVGAGATALSFAP